MSGQLLVIELVFFSYPFRSPPTIYARIVVAVVILFCLYVSAVYLML